MAGPKRILVVDDDPRNLRLAQAMLSAEGYAVRCVDSGAAALAAIAESRPELVLLDLMMPDMDGFEVVRRLKAETGTRDLPVLCLSAIDDEGARTRLAALGTAGLLTKPLDRWALKATIEALLAPGDPHGDR